MKQMSAVIEGECISQNQREIVVGVPFTTEGKGENITRLQG